MPDIFDLAQLSAMVALSIGEYAPIRSAYGQAIEGSILEYLYSDNVRITRFKSQIGRAITEDFVAAFELGYTDGGGTLPYESDDNEFLIAKQDAELGYVADLFQKLKDFKKEATKAEFEGEAANRAEGYCKTLDGIYSAGKARGAGNIMLTLGGNDGQESCPTCQRLKGQRHRASWWVNHDLLIYRGNDNYDCGNYQFQHGLFDDKGNLFTI